MSSQDRKPTILESILHPVNNNIDSGESERVLRDFDRQLEERGISVAISQPSPRTTIAILTERDGWETLGVAYTQTPWSNSLVVGARFALADAFAKLGSGRFFQRNDPMSATASKVSLDGQFYGAVGQGPNIGHQQQPGSGQR